MKKTITLLSVVLLTTSLFAQQRTRSFFGWHLTKDQPIQLNEVKINLGTTILALHPEITYERIIGEDFSLGASAGISLNSYDYPLGFALTPFARWFFGGSSVNLQKYGAGFFIELNGSLFQDNNDEYNFENGYNVYSSSNDIGAGLGLAVGWKYLSRNNWVGEFYLGGGRDFVNDSGYPRMGISIGKRF